MSFIKGQIRKALSGFYYVYTEDGQYYQTRGRGNFRAKKQTPLVGDYVSFESHNEQEGVLLKLYPRKNELVRPPICNIDNVVIVMSAVEPDFSTALLDRYIVNLEKMLVNVVVYVSKMDKVDARQSVVQQADYYRQIGYSVFYSDEHSLDELKQLLKGTLTVLMGQSGAGKSTLLNTLLPELALETNTISTHLGRGKHTTRHVEVHDVEGCFIADTPGFSSMNFFGIDAQRLTEYFVDIDTCAQDCRFRGCQHIHEPNCAVKEKSEHDVLFATRYQHYLQFHEEIQNQKVIYKK